TEVTGGRSERRRPTAGLATLEPGQSPQVHLEGIVAESVLIRIKQRDRDRDGPVVYEGRGVECGQQACCIERHLPSIVLVARELEAVHIKTTAHNTEYGMANRRDGYVNDNGVGLHALQDVPAAGMVVRDHTEERDLAR